MIKSISELIKYNLDLANILGGSDEMPELVLTPTNEQKNCDVINKIFLDVPWSYKSFLNSINMNEKMYWAILN